ncbi:dipeptide/oligopeptide/nickel ABC transporter permease/ATP-binding protein [Caballeronia sp. LZ043]|uniref:dipeptide/oligopeptide/nickel ABC transporter permease/ATP-binding protein n=1 Tax=Caballeronia sp. LZ043 TaxID=3038569 RepID=UPI00285D557B|nr:dipeptide/oligopeptide/nickel ABC transporter permease/ATP-binding protein [Caballeronia sp. LZ043]MDR5822342.1 dipeptide/oligopeptide/nickel ABC transporter permease/ATP-binding protein [Caballeronia sp. LZ043]
MANVTGLSGAVTNPPRAKMRLRLLRQILSQPKGVIGVALALGFVLLALLGPSLAPFDPLAQSFSDTLQPPSAAHWFGTDQLGRDIFSRVLTGASISLAIGMGGVALALACGVPLGIIAACQRGKTDTVIMRGIDVMLSFPDIIFALAIVALLGADTKNVIVAVGLVSIPVYARTVRAVTLSVLAEPYMEGARALGCGPLRLILRHVLPNISGAVLTLSSLLFASTLLTASGLGFIGLGVQAPAPEWGAMLGDSRSYLQSQPWMAAFPGVFLALAALAFNLLGEALRVVFDPTARHAPRKSSVRTLAERLRTRAAKDADALANPSREAHLREPAAPVAVRDLSVDFMAGRARRRIIRSVDLTAQRGRTLAVVGESGSGKSTLLRTLGTLLPADRARIAQGVVSIAGQDVTRLSNPALLELRRTAIGYVFQDAGSALNPVLTIGAQLAEAVGLGTSLSRDAVRQRCIALLAEVGISAPESRLRMYPHQFSGGMKQRIVIAIALAQRPQILLADEPTSALDVTIQRQILDLLRKLTGASGMTTVIVTHDLGMVARHADDVAVMYAGEIVERGAVSRVFAGPLHPYTVALRRSTLALDGTRGRLLDAIEGEPPSLDTPGVGCPFQPRCTRSKARSECRTIRPLPRPVDGVIVACHFAEETA